MLVLQELHFNGQDVEARSRFLAQAIEFLQADGVFFRRHNQLGSGKPGVCLVDECRVRRGEIVMVAESELGDGRAVAFQVHSHLFRRGDAREEQDVLVRAQGFDRAFSFAEERPEAAVSQGGEEQFLIRVKLQGLADDPEPHGLDVRRAFGHDDDAGTAFPFFRLAQASGRQELVIADHTVIVYKEYVDARLHVAVLERVVQKDDFRAWGGLLVAQPFDSPSAVFTSTHTFADMRIGP